jgi:beta-phosphoglucomutase-like phosphatase (HAD superfamily)
MRLGVFCADIPVPADGRRLSMIDFMKLEAVIWDMDGVLLDSRSAHYKAMCEIFKKYRITVSEERMWIAFGMTNQQVIQLMADQPISKELTDRIGREKDILFQSY